MGVGLSILLPPSAKATVDEIEKEHGLKQFPPYGWGTRGMAQMIEVKMGPVTEKEPYVRLLFVAGLPFTAKIRGWYKAEDYKQLRAVMHVLAEKYDFRL